MIHVLNENICTLKEDHLRAIVGVVVKIVSSLRQRLMLCNFKEVKYRKPSEQCACERKWMYFIVRAHNNIFFSLPSLRGTFPISPFLPVCPQQYTMFRHPHAALHPWMQKKRVAVSRDMELVCLRWDAAQRNTNISGSQLKTFVLTFHRKAHVETSPTGSSPSCRCFTCTATLSSGPPPAALVVRRWQMCPGCSSPTNSVKPLFPQQPVMFLVCLHVLCESLMWIHLLAHMSAIVPPGWDIIHCL